MPGSFGSLAALPCAWAIRGFWGTMGLALATAILFAIGWWAAAAVTRANSIRDPGEIVVDEVAGQWLVLLFVPPDFLGYVAAFVLFRIFDIWKPWPVGWADREFHGGFGIMLDDALAAVYAALILSGLLVTGGGFGV
jgi:phosphatidylglycerophosphatase A